jgi:hypothetical protein
LKTKKNRKQQDPAVCKQRRTGNSRIRRAVNKEEPKTAESEGPQTKKNRKKQEAADRWQKQNVI